MSRLSAWLTVNESENFAAAYLPSRTVRVLVAFFMESFSPSRCLPLGVSELGSIPATLADRLDDTKFAEDTAVKLVLIHTLMEAHLSYGWWAGNRPVPRQAVCQCLA